MRIEGPFLHIYKLPNFYLICGMLMWIILSALGVIYAKHKIRTLHIELQAIYLERSNFNTEWSKLLLEKSTLLADFRVEGLAKNKLELVHPEQVYIIRQ